LIPRTHVAGSSVGSGLKCQFVGLWWCDLATLLWLLSDSWTAVVDVVGLVVRSLMLVTTAGHPWTGVSVVGLVVLGMSVVHVLVAASNSVGEQCRLLD
jgi:hypothetical protein